MGLFGSPTPALLIALPAIGDDAAHVLDTVRLSSTLDVQSAGRPDEYVVTHTLAGATFASFTTAGTAEVALTPLALPALTAYTAATTREGCWSSTTTASRCAWDASRAPASAPSPSRPVGCRPMRGA